MIQQDAAVDDISVLCMKWRPDSQGPVLYPSDRMRSVTGF